MILLLPSACYPLPAIHPVLLLQLTSTRPRPGRFRQMNALHPLPGSST